MKSNIKKKSRYGANILLTMILIFMSVSIAQAAVSTDRTIENNTLIAGNATNVTVSIQNDNTQRSLALQETVPTGWVLTRISDDADQFKASTNEWVWFSIASNAAKTVKYKITVPSGTVPGIYNINGNIVSSGNTTSVTGDNTIEVVAQSSDAIAPTTSISGVVKGTTYTDNVTITLTATDNPGGSGVNETLYKVDAGPTTTYTAPFIVSKEGTTVITYWSVDKVGNTETANTTDFIINKNPPTVSFGFIVNPPSSTVYAGDAAKYNLTVSNTGNATDTYDLVADQPTNTIVNLAKNNVTVDPGNSSVIGLTVNSSTAGTYIVGITATSRANTSNSIKVTTTTNVIKAVVPVLTVTNLKSVPSTAISSTNIAKISAIVTKGLLNINIVEFGLTDSNNLLGKGANAVPLYDDNFSGAEGLYETYPWPGNYGTITNGVTDIVTIYRESDDPGYVKVKGTFKETNTSSDVDAVLSFNVTTGSLSNVKSPSDTVLNIQDGNSTFKAKIAKSVNGSLVYDYTSTNVFTLYSLTGNSSSNNPHVAMKTVPNGNYKVYALAKDANNTAIQWIDVDTKPKSTGGGGGSGGSGTYPTATATPKKVNQTTTTPTQTTPRPTVTVTQPVSTQTEGGQEEPVDMSKKGSPGFEIILLIGAIVAIYIVRKVK